MSLDRFGIALAAIVVISAGLKPSHAAENRQTGFPVLTLSTNDRIMVMAPHPDDESLGCGGIIQAAVAQRIPVQVVFFTYGDNNQWSFALYRKHPVLEPRAVQAMGLVRHTEALQAAHTLGLATNQLTFLGYPDFGALYIWNNCWGAHPPYRSMLTKTTEVPYANAFRPGAPYTGENILQDLTKLFREFKPTKIFLSHPADHNPDHRALYLFARVALWDLASEMRPELWPYLTHCAQWPRPQGLHPAMPLDPPDSLRATANWRIFPLSSNQVTCKLAALREHKSQFRYSGKYLSAFVRQNELFGDLDAVNLLAPHELNPGAPGIEPVSDLPEELTDEERQVYTGIAWDYARREDDCLVLAVNVSRPLSQTVEAEVSAFGYRFDRPFPEMPKLRVSLGKLTHRVMDGRQRLTNENVSVTYRNKSITLRVPLSALGNPDRILISARTSRAEVPFDWVAWRVLISSAKRLDSLRRH